MRDRAQLQSRRSQASNARPLHIVQVTFSPIVFSSRSGTDITPTYFDAKGVEIPKDRVIASVIDSDGIVHIAGGMSFRLAVGHVVGFALYGRATDHFGTLQSFEDVVAMFGPPNRSREKHAYGDLMGCELYYAGLHKHVEWDVGNRIALVNLGDWPRDF